MTADVYAAGQKIGKSAMKENEAIVRTVLHHYPAVQGIYLFGSRASGDDRPDSDMDLALLFGHEQSKHLGLLALSECGFHLEEALGKSVDLVNARMVSTVLQKEIISGDVIFCANRFAVDEFEMLVLSQYQRLNRERADILESFRKTKRAYAV